MFDRPLTLVLVVLEIIHCAFFQYITFHLSEGRKFLKNFLSFCEKNNKVNILLFFHFFLFSSKTIVMEYGIWVMVG